MKFTYMSDLHLEVGEVMPQHVDKHLKGGDCLVLAGDICTIPALPRLKHFDHFLKVATERFDHVLAIAGNHETYKASLKDIPVLREYYTQRSVKFLDDECIELDGLLIFGTTLWTDMNKRNPITINVVSNYMNDFKVIRDEEDNILHPSVVADKCIRSMELINLHKPDVVISHHAPSRQSVHPRYYDQGDANYGYYSDLIPPDSVQLWIHGHVHHTTKYKHKANDITEVRTNPRGYLGWDRNPEFSFEASFEVCS